MSENDEKVVFRSEGESALSRVADYSVVKDCCGKAGEYYQWIKSGGGRLGSSLAWTESVVAGAVSKVEPFASQHLEPLNKYACTKLDDLETKYPIVKESSEDVLKASSQYYESNIKPRVDTVVAAPYRITTQTIETLSNTANNFVSHYMNIHKTVRSDESLVDHSYNDTFKQAIKEVNMIQHYTRDSVQGLTSLLSSIYNRTVTNNEEWLRQYYEEFKTEVNSKSIAQSTETDTNSKLMSLAVALSNKVRLSVRAMSTVCYSHLSPEYQERLDLVFAKTEQLYNNINLSTYDTVREKLSMENVHWIGDSLTVIIKTVKDTVEERYKEYSGVEEHVKVDEEICESDNFKSEED